MATDLGILITLHLEYLRRKILRLLSQSDITLPTACAGLIFHVRLFGRFIHDGRVESLATALNGHYVLTSWAFLFLGYKKENIFAVIDTFLALRLFILVDY
jgi:hypothetical protein